MMNLSIIISILSLVGISNIFSQWIKKEFELLFYYSCLFSIFILYIAGLTNTLEATVILLRYIGLAGMLLFLSSKFRNSFKITYGMIFLIISTAFLIWSINTANYEYYYGSDDYHHWGKIMRHVTMNNRLLEYNDPVEFKDYPHGTALFQYIFSYFTEYKINIGIFGQGVLTLSILSLFFTSAPKKFNIINNIIFIINIFIIYSMIWFFRYGFHTLQTDLILGSTFGISICIYQYYKKQSYLYAILMSAPSILSLVIFKHIGILFVFFAITILFIDSIYNNKNKKDIHKISFTIIGIIIIAIILKNSWSTYLLNQGIAMTLGREFTIIDVVKAFIPSYSTEEHKIIIKSYINYLFFSDHSSTYWFLISLILLYADNLIAKENKLENQNTIYIGLYLCLLVYLLILLILYLMVFGFYEASRVMSATRYINTFLLPIVLVISFNLIYKLIKIKFQTKYIKTSIFAILITILPNISMIFSDTFATLTDKHSQQEVFEVEQMAKITVDNTNQNDSIYFIWSNSDNDKSHIFNYSIYPRKSNQDCISIKTIDEYDLNSDPWSCFISAKEFEKKIINYEYIYIGYASEKFINNFFKLHNNELNPNGLYKIKYLDRNNKITFEKVNK